MLPFSLVCILTFPTMLAPRDASFSRPWATGLRLKCATRKDDSARETHVCTGRTRCDRQAEGVSIATASLGCRAPLRRFARSRTLTVDTPRATRDTEGARLLRRGKTRQRSPGPVRSDSPRSGWPKCEIRTKPTTDSASCRPPIPSHVDHVYRRRTDHLSERIRTRPSIRIQWTTSPEQAYGFTGIRNIQQSTPKTPTS
jgi:hypothetical protein